VRLCILLSLFLITSSDIGAQETFLSLRTKAILGESEAQYTLGLAYLGHELDQSFDRTKSRMVTNPDVKQAINWLSKSSEKGHRGAMFQLSLIYSGANGESFQDLSLSLKFARQAALLGDNMSTYMVANIYEYGKGVPRDMIESYAWHIISSSRAGPFSRDSSAKMANWESLGLITRDGINEAVRRSRQILSQASDVASSRGPSGANSYELRFTERELNGKAIWQEELKRNFPSGVIRVSTGSQLAVLQRAKDEYVSAGWKLERALRFGTGTDQERYLRFKEAANECDVRLRHLKELARKYGE
jgi:hypothetical protein